MKKFACLIFLLFYCVIIQSQPQSPFESFKNEVRAHWSNGNRSEAIFLLKSKKAFYLKAAEQHTIIFYLGLLYLETSDYKLETSDYKKSFRVFDEGFDRSFFFSFGDSYTKKIANNSEGRSILERNEANRKTYLQTSSVKTKTILPAKYDAKRKYPLLYFFHGNNSSLESLKNEWENVELSTEIIVVLAQSGFPRSNQTFDWIENKVSDEGSKTIHKEISAKYSIDESRVMVGGFSNGGRMAIRLFVYKTLPIHGFLAFSPSKPATITQRVFPTRLNNQKK